MSSEFKLSDQTNVSLPVKNIVALEENVHTKVLINQLEKKVDKLEKELDSVRGK